MRLSITAAAAASLTALAAAGSALSTAPGTNGRIIYQQELNGRGQLFTIRPDGTGRKQLTHGPTESVNGSWSPDGKSIVFEQSNDTHAGVMIMNADGTGVRDLTPSNDFQGDPSFSPDGKTIVYSRTTVDKFDEVWLMNADGSNQRNLRSTRNRGVGTCGCDVDPVFSPDGKRITYVRVIGDFGTDQALMSVRIDGTGLKRLTPPSFEPGIKHDWSPDGKLILFSSPGDPTPGKSGNLWVMRPDGTHKRQLTHYAGGASNAFSGSFSPDGKWIVFRKEDAKGYHLSRIRPDGTGFRVITSDSAVPQRSSSWGTAR